MTDTKRYAVDRDMTIYTAMQVKTELTHAIIEDHVEELDLSKVREFDSAGFQLLALAKREAETSGATVNIVAYSDAVADLVKLYGKAEWLSA